MSWGLRKAGAGKAWNSTKEAAFLPAGGGQVGVTMLQANFPEVELSVSRARRRQDRKDGLWAPGRCFTPIVLLPLHRVF